MPKLYYTPTSCGASSFISAFIREIKIECEVVDLMTHMTESGVDFYTINPKGNVPTLVLDDGTVLNENITCLEYIANMPGFGELAPKQQSSKRYQLQQILSFLATELHSAIGLFFNPASKDPQIRDFVQTVFNKKMNYLQKHILCENKEFVFEDSFTIADAYLHIILSWTGYVGIDLSQYPIAHSYYKRICDMPGVKAAKNRMSTIPKTTF